MRLFYDANIADTASLNESEAKHLRVLRTQIGDEIAVIDGKGNLFTCRVTGLTKKNCEVTILETTKHTKPNKHIHIAISPTKNQDRIEWFVEKCIEIGVQKISFLTCDRSERKKINLERIERIAISAIKQSKSYWLPEIVNMIPYKAFLQKNKDSCKMIAHLNEGERKHIHQLAKNESSSCILIGPEGDFTDSEVQLANENGFKAVSLGESRLRTETAGISACLQLNLLDLYNA